ncbi:MAG: HNH endonuclease [Phyllobacteriaceae bacterium]|nr:HNH endonuclease [Phyllobacteriaceae bacterium]
MNKNSAYDYVSNVAHLLKGESYTRVMRIDATQLYLDRIRNDFGSSKSHEAACAVLRHVDYYSRLRTGGPQKKIRIIAESFLSAAEPISLVDFDAIVAEALKSALETSPQERQQHLANANPKPTTRQVTLNVFNRNPDVIVEILYRANGICEHCKNHAPFNRNTDGRPYLEVHHRIPLAEGGDDTVANAIALCPNCHREAHFGADWLRFRT